MTASPSPSMPTSQSSDPLPAIFKKLNLKAATEILVVNAPASFEAEVAALTGITVHRSIAKVKALHFVLAFVTQQAELDALSKSVAAKAVGDAIVWFAYPKQSSKKYSCTFHRDTGWDVLGQAGYEKVRMVAIDTDWSALRFRKAEFVKLLTRDATRILSDDGKRRVTAKLGKARA